MLQCARYDCMGVTRVSKRNKVATQEARKKSVEDRDMSCV